MIKAVSLYKSYGDKEIFRDFNLSLDGGLHALTGKSGSGKTTFLRLLSGLETPDAGQVLCSNPLSVAFQENRLLPWYSVLKNVEIVSDSTIARTLLYEMGLEAELYAYPGKLSGGMQRRVSVARALAHGADTVLLDEPFAGLDGETAEAVFQVIRKYTAGKTVLIATHNTELANRADSVICI